MDLDETECWARLAGTDHAVLGTVHPTVGVDAVPVVFALSDQRIVVPIDTVKAKSGPRLQRLRNLERDPRCVLLADHYDADWSRLWWVRAHAHGVERAPTGPIVAPLLERYPQYRDPGAITALIVLIVDRLTGWAARPNRSDDGSIS